MGLVEALAENTNLHHISMQPRVTGSFSPATVAAYAQLIQQLTVSNPTLFSAFLAAIRSEGEAAALRRVAADVDRLLERQPELACE